MLKELIMAFRSQILPHSVVNHAVRQCSNEGSRDEVAEQKRPTAPNLSTCHLMMIFACHVCQMGGVLSRSRCCGAHVHPSCRDPDQLCLFCVDMDCNEAALDEGNFVLCTLDQDENNSLILPCCNRIHVGCSAHAVQHCRTRCPFCRQDVRQQVVAMERDGTFSANGLSVAILCATLPTSRLSRTSEYCVATDSVGLQISLHWKTGEWSGHRFTQRLVMMSGSCSGSADFVVGTSRWVMSLRCSQDSALVVPLHWVWWSMLTAHGQPFLVQSNQWWMCQVGFHHYMVRVLAHSQCLGLAPSHGCFAHWFLLGLERAEVLRGVDPFSVGGRPQIPPQAQFLHRNVPHLIEALAAHFIAVALSSRESWEFA